MSDQRTFRDERSSAAPSPAAGPWQVHYAPGEWLICAGGRSLVVLRHTPECTSDVIGALWPDLRTAGSRGEVLAALARHGLDTEPDLAVIVDEGSAARCLVRGAVQVRELGRAGLLADGRGHTELCEATVHGSAVRIEFGASGGTDPLVLPLELGVALCSTITVELNPALLPSRGGARTTGVAQPVRPRPPQVPAVSLYEAPDESPAASAEALAAPDENRGATARPHDETAPEPEGAAMSPQGETPGAAAEETTVPPAGDARPDATGAAPEPEADSAAPAPASSPKPAAAESGTVHHRDWSTASDKVLTTISEATAAAAPPASVPSSPATPAEPEPEEPPLPQPGTEQLTPSEPPQETIPPGAAVDDGTGTEPGDEPEAPMPGFLEQALSDQDATGTEQQASGAEPPAPAVPEEPKEVVEWSPHGWTDESSRVVLDHPCATDAFMYEKTELLGQQAGAPQRTDGETQETQAESAVPESGGAAPTKDSRPVQQVPTAPAEPEPGTRQPEHQPSAGPEQTSAPDVSQPIPSVEPAGPLPAPVEPPAAAPEPVGPGSGRQQTAPGMGGQGGSAEGFVLAQICPNGHPNRPGATSCRVCGLKLGDAEPQPVQRPLVADLVTSGGQVLQLTGPVLIGRAPRPAPGENAQLLRVQSPHHDISRTHVRVAPHEWDIAVTDMNSTNGTIVFEVGNDPIRLGAGETVLVGLGTVVDLGDGQQVSIEAPQE